VDVHDFETVLVGGEIIIQDPDELIYDIAWKSKGGGNPIAINLSKQSSIFFIKKSHVSST